MVEFLRSKLGGFVERLQTSHNRRQVNEVENGSRLGGPF